MLIIKKKYECKLEKATIANIDYWVSVINGKRKAEGSIPKAQIQLKNYIARIAKTAFDKGMQEGAKQRGK